MIDERDMTLGRDWEGERLTGWLLSEKLDGCRAYWDGRTLWTRGGKVITAPARILNALPAGHSLDGEVWAGRGLFHEASVAVRLGRWTSNCRFVAFDCPEASGTWEQRMAEARRVFADCVEFRPFESVRQVNSWLLDIQEAGGEGLVARSGRAQGYERGRTSNFLKIKSLIHRPD